MLTPKPSPQTVDYPKEIYRCDVPGCGQEFVRFDLLSRHRKRHTANYIPRNRFPSFNTALKRSPGSSPARLQSPGTEGGHAPRGTNHLYPGVTGGGMPHDGNILLTPESATAPTTSTAGGANMSSHAHASSSHSSGPNPPPPQQHGQGSWASAPHSHQPPPMDDMSANIIRPRGAPAGPATGPMYHKVDPPSAYHHAEHAAAPAPQADVMQPFGGVQFPQASEVAIQHHAHHHHRDSNFAMWLFDDVLGGPSYPASSFLTDGGLESTFNSNINYEYESSLTSRSQLDVTPPRQIDPGDELISERRRQEILHWFQTFRAKQPRYEPFLTNIGHENGGDIPGLDLDMMRDCLHEYWEHVSPRLPIVHQPTFSPNRCPILLLLVMIALGAVSLRSRDVTGTLSEYGTFADVIITSIRWEILPLDDARPPVCLWVAQALLLLELYEKMYSTRPLHERAHIYHNPTLTLLRRGSPLIGRGGSESPPELAMGVQQGGDAESAAAAAADLVAAGGFDSRAWWTRWAERESMHRVVFAAFVMDIIHAAMFGHTADMSPHEIRLPLPCDDNLWTAQSPDVVRQLDSNLRMYGVSPVSFLDGLKHALHGQEVKSHSFGRMIVMSGLLSVGWHLMHREANLKWLEFATPSQETQDKWRRMLLSAFDGWKESFDSAMGSSDSISTAPGHRSGFNGPIQSASVLYHLAHISLHVNIIDCQVYAGARRLLGRKISSRDYTNVVQRMKGWAQQSGTRHAILHAFKLLHRVLVEPRLKKQRSGGFVLVPTTSSANATQNVQYSIRADADPHRPWIMYYAALSIWCFVQALGGSGGKPITSLPGLDGQERIANYLGHVASLNELDERTAATLYHGLADLLDVLYGIFDEAHWELLKEAQQRLKFCRDVLIQGRREG